MAALFQEIGNPFCDTNTLHNIETGEQPPNEVVTDLRRTFRFAFTVLVKLLAPGEKRCPKFFRIFYSMFRFTTYHSFFENRVGFKV